MPERRKYSNPYRPLILNLDYSKNYGDYRVEWRGNPYHDIYLIRVNDVTAHAKSTGEVYFSSSYRTGGDDSTFIADIVLIRGDGIVLERELLITHFWPHTNDTTRCTTSRFIEFVFDHWEEIQANEWKLQIQIREKRKP